MSTLRESIHALAQTFAAGVLQAIRGASLEDILGESSGAKRGPGRPPGTRGPGRPPGRRGPGRPPGTRGPGRPPGTRGPGRPPGSSSKRLPRRSAKDLSAVTDSIVALVKKNPKGLRAEQIRAELGIAKKEWMRPLGLALSSKKLTKKGEKRSTTYFAG
jgi:hypothetical protein